VMITSSRVMPAMVRNRERFGRLSAVQFTAHEI
jgi:hypothetical protein